MGHILAYYSPLPLPPPASPSKWGMLRGRKLLQPPRRGRGKSTFYEAHRSPRPVSHRLVPPELLVEGPAGDAEAAGGFALVAAAGFEGLEDRLPLPRLEGGGPGAGGWRSSGERRPVAAGLSSLITSGNAFPPLIVAAVTSASSAGGRPQLSREEWTPS